FLRYACLQNPHLRPVNCGFSGCASLKLHLFIHLPENEAAKKYFLVSLIVLGELHSSGLKFIYQKRIHISWTLIEKMRSFILYSLVCVGIQYSR
ncbi:MAG: hypothetical protein IJ277_08115, partial [Bacteroidaceae bacterium]|nr:hypothetical protein [Bacteroidaceae bacterium]